MKDQLFARLFVISMFGVSVYLLFLIFRPFLSVIAWAVFLVTAFYPVYEKILRLVRSRATTAAIVTSGLVAALIVVPAAVMTLSLARSVTQLASDFEDRIRLSMNLPSPAPDAGLDALMPGAEPATEPADILPSNGTQAGLHSNAGAPGGNPAGSAGGSGGPGGPAAGPGGSAAGSPSGAPGSTGGVAGWGVPAGAGSAADDRRSASEKAPGTEGLDHLGTPATHASAPDAAGALGHPDPAAAAGASPAAAAAASPTASGNAGHERWRLPLIADLEKFLGRYVDVTRFDLEGTAIATLKRLGQVLAVQTRSLVQNAIWTLLMFVIMLFTMVYLFREGPNLLQTCKRAIPLDPKDRDAVFVRLHQMSRAVFYGVFMTSVVQAILGGIGWAMVGLPSALTFGIAMFFCSLIPVGGTALIWVPGAAFLFLQGHPVRGLLLAVWGAAIVGMVDNVLRPVFISGRTQMHTLLVFFGVMGGIAAFGIGGIFLGPLLITVFLFLLEVIRRDLFPSEETPRQAPE